jgi:hypothetical protein
MPARRHPGSDRARLIAALVLDVLGGNRSPVEAAQGLSVSLARYYALEHQAIAGLVVACEPRSRGGGPRQDVEKQMATLQAENRRLQQSLLRQQALVRAGQRSLGMMPAPRPAMSGKVAVEGGRKRRRRRPQVRALRAARTLTAPPPATSTPAPQGETGADRSGG